MTDIHGLKPNVRPNTFRHKVRDVCGNVTAGTAVSDSTTAHAENHTDRSKKHVQRTHQH